MALNSRKATAALASCEVVTASTVIKLKYFSSNFTHLNLFLGEAMEKGLRDCCRSIRIGKILIQSETSTSKPQVNLLYSVILCALAISNCCLVNTPCYS